MKNLKICFMVLIISLMSSCVKDTMNVTSGSVEKFPVLKSSSAKIKIAVVTDIHYMSPALLPVDILNSPPHQPVLYQYDSKMLEVSDPIFNKVISELSVEKPDILLIPGDMANCGELLNHQYVEGKLKELAQSGIKVYVIPGNNDINNRFSYSFKDDALVSVPNINPEGFLSLYGDFGYNNALYRDVNSLSYIAQPYSNLWILGIDDCKYIGTPKNSGAVKPATLAWIQEKMAEARDNNITVLAMMHHGINEHFKLQTEVSANSVIDNFQQNAIALMNAGVRLIFTGHTNANDLTDFTNDGKTLTDIETGSLVTPPSPYRVLTLDDNFIKIETRKITTIDTPLPDGMSFPEYSIWRVARYMDITLKSLLQTTTYGGLTPELAEISTSYLRNAMIAQFAGDEWISPEEQRSLEELAMKVPPLAMVRINNFWTDLPPNDNKIHIKLK